MERLKNMGLKKSFLLLSLSCLAVAFLLLGAVIFLCRGIESYYPLGGVEILSDGSIVPLPSPTASQQRILAILNIVQTLSCILFPVGGLIVSVFLFYYLKLKWPISCLQNGIMRIQNNDLDFSLPILSNDEMGQLCAAFEEMRSELLKSNRLLWQQAEERKRLNAAFSHDLRNPITVLKGSVLILSGAITLAFALFAALPAARSAARVSPIMAMSGTNLKIRRRKRKTKKIHNFEAYYARLNLKRNKGRTAITILSLVMSITVFIALQGFSSLLNAASALQDNHVGDYQITNESIGFTTDDLNTLRKNEAVQSVAAIQFSLYEQNENGLLDEISLEFQLKPGETFQVVGLNDEYWDYFMGDQLPEEQLGQLKSGNACIVRNPIPMSYGEDVLEFTNIEAGENICVAGMELNVLKTLDGYDGYLGIGNGGFTNGVQVIVDDAIYERLTGKDTYSEFLPTLNEGADRENFDTFIEAFCNRIPGTTFLSYEETDQQLKESFAQIQMLAWGLILFVGLIGILNIINTVYTNIHTRVTEIGMQRAIGMSAGSLYKTFLWEGAYYGIIASVIGSVLGYVCTIFIEAATSDTLQLVAIPVIPILEATLLAVGACLMATAIPLRKISKMSIVDSIETVE